MTSSRDQWIQVGEIELTDVRTYKCVKDGYFKGEAKR